MKIKRKFKKIWCATALAFGTFVMLGAMASTLCTSLNQKSNHNNQAKTFNNQNISTPQPNIAIDGDFTLNSDNKIQIRNQENQITDNQYTAITSKGVGIGPQGYLLQNDDTLGFEYVGYDGKIIWTTESNLITWAIHADYDEQTGMFTIWGKYGQDNPLLKFVAIDANNGQVAYQYVIEDTSSYGFDYGNFEYLIISKIANTPSGIIGYSIYPGNISVFNQKRCMVCFFGIGNKPATPMNGTTYDNNPNTNYPNAWFSYKGYTLTTGGGADGFIWRAQSFYNDNNYYEAFILKYANNYTDGGKRISYVISENYVQKTWQLMTENSHTILSDKFIRLADKCGATFFWSNGVDIQFLCNATTTVTYLLCVSYNWNDNSLYFKIADMNNYEYLDYDTVSFNIYKNSLYAYGNHWYDGGDHCDKLLMINLGKQNSTYVDCANNSTGDIIKNDDVFKVVDSPQQFLNSTDKNVNYGMWVLPSYSETNCPYTNVNIGLELNNYGSGNLNGRKSWISVTSDGNYAYQTNKSSTEEIILENKNSILAYKVTNENLSEWLTLENIFPAINQFRIDTTITNNLTLTGLTVDQNLYAQGKLKTNITLDKTYNGTNQVVSSTFNDVIVSGFKTITETTTLENISVNGTLATKTPYAVQDSEIEDWIKNNITSVFDENTLPYLFNASNITSVTIDSRNGNSINVNITINSYFKNQSYSSNEKIFPVQITGFTQQPSTQFIAQNPISDPSFQQYAASAQSYDENKIQTFLNSKINELFAPLPDGATISIDSNSIQYNRNEGQITLNIRPSKYYDANGNETTTEWFNEIQLTGFNTQQPTRQVNSTKNDTSLNSQAASSFTNQNANEYLNNNKTYFFENLPPDVTFNITSLTPNNNDGSVEITFTLSQHYNDDGILVDGSDPYTITISGFKNTGLTTNVPSTMDLSGVSNILASDVTDSQSEIISAIVNGNFITSTNGELGTSDLSFTVVPNTADNVNQQVKINLSINNNKYWVNGTSQSTYTCEITLTGFKQQLPTQQIKTTESNPDWSNQSANSFTQENALTYINSNKDSFFTNLPDNTTLTITNFTPNISTGQITFNVNLNQYYNDKGILVQENKTYSITFRGFQTTGLTTNVPSTMALSGVSNILASDVTNNQSNIITAIINGRFITSTNGTLQTSDLSFTIVANTADNVNRQVKINLSINNNKYWENGTPQSTYSRQVTLTGFKQQKASSFNAPLNVSGNDIEEQRQNLINGINDGSINLANSPYYIPDANADGVVNMNDISITEENGQLVITPKKIYNSKGILTDNTTGQKITVARPSSDPTYSNPTSSEKKWEGWMIIVIVCSIIGAIFLIILFALLGRYLSNKRHLNDDSIDF